MNDLKIYKNKAAMLNISKDKLDKLSISLPEVDMPTLMGMMAYLSKQHITFKISETRNVLKEEAVRTTRKERKKKVNERLNRIHLSDEEYSRYFARKQKEYDVEVSEKLLELEEWYDDYYTFEMRTPNEQEFANKLQELKEELKELDSRINADIFFRDVPNDIVFCGRILVKNEIKWNSSDEQKAVCLMSALQWLVRLKNDSSAITMPISEYSISTPLPTAIQEEDAETTELLQLLANLNITIENDQSSIAFDGKCYSQGQILTALMQKYQDEGKEWAKNPNRFSKKIVLGTAESIELTPELKNKGHAIYKRILRAKKHIGNALLKNLSAESIQEATETSLKGAKTEYDKWDGLYPSVQKILDTVRKRRADRNGQYIE